MYSVKEREFVASECNNAIKSSRISLRGQLALNTLWFGLNAQSSALLAIVIPTQIVLFVSSNQVGSVQQVLFLSWLLVAASIITLFIPPLVGALSDQTPSHFGRRRPYIVIGGLLLVLSTPLLVNSGSMAIFVSGLALLLVGKNILVPAYQSLMPDRVPVEQRGVTAGFVGGMTILGNVVGLGLAVWLLGGINQHASSLGMIRSHAGIYYIVTAFLVLVGVLVTVFGVHEIPLLIQGHELSSKREKTLLELAQRYTEDLAEPWRSSNFRMVFLTRASLMLGLMLFMTFIEYYFARVQHIANFVLVTGIVAMLALGGVVVSGFVSCQTVSNGELQSYVRQHYA
jgi:MFS family permease